MGTVFATFDDSGELIAMVVIPETVNLDTVRHLTEGSYAQKVSDMSEDSVDEAISYLTQIHANDMRKKP